MRAEGAVERLTEEESDAYFASRGRGSRLGAWASKQGTPIPDRAVLEAALAAASERYPGEDVPRPEYWGGYRLVPERGRALAGPPEPAPRPRALPARADGAWRSERLSP